MELRHAYGTISSARHTTDAVARQSWKDNRATAANRHHDSFHPDPRDITRLESLMYDVLQTGGATITRDYGDIAMHDSGYYVGGKWPGVKYRTNAYSVRELAILAHKYIVSSPTYIEPTYVGFWIDSGILHIDTVTWHERAGDAVDAGLKREQVAIFDIARGTDIFLDAFR
jgi:hypothetical protein